MRERVLSICTGMGLMDRAYLDAGYDVIAGCEIDADKRAMYRELCGGAPLVHDLKDLPAAVAGQRFAGIIGGPSCQSHSKLRAMVKPKFPDLTPLVLKLLAAVQHDWFKFENVVPIDIPGAKTICLNAMHFYQPHQSRERWFTFTPYLVPPVPMFKGTVDDLMAYSVVAGRIYGPKRGARLQGYPEIASMKFRCTVLQHGLADAVPYPLALAWAHSIRGSQEL